MKVQKLKLFKRSKLKLLHKFFDLLLGVIVAKILRQSHKNIKSPLASQLLVFESITELQNASSTYISLGSENSGC